MPRPTRTALLRGLAALALCFAVAVTASPVEAQPGWERLRARRYGRTWVSFLERTSQ